MAQPPGGVITQEAASRPRGVAVSVVDLPATGEAWPADLNVLDRPTVEATMWALEVVIAAKDDDIPGMEILAARLGSPGVYDTLNQKKRRRELLWQLLQALTRAHRQLDAVTKP